MQIEDVCHSACVLQSLRNDTWGLDSESQSQALNKSIPQYMIFKFPGIILQWKHIGVFLRISFQNCIVGILSTFPIEFCCILLPCCMSRFVTTFSVTGSSSLSSDTAAAKIVELSKKVRELNASLETKKTEAKQLFGRCRHLENEVCATRSLSLFFPL